MAVAVTASCLSGSTLFSLLPKNIKLSVLSRALGCPEHTSQHNFQVGGHVTKFFLVLV